MSTPETDRDTWERIRDNHNELEQVAERDDRLGALARITLDLANDERPTDDDLERLGVDAPPEADR